MSQPNWSVSLILLSFIISGLFTGCSGQKQMIDNSVVKELDLQKYLGTWYEIARYDHRFERGMVGVTANYSMRPDGKIKVVNSGYQDTLDGEYSEAIGKAKIPDPENDPAKLKVSFFWIFYGDYYVLELDEDYQWAVIGSSTDKYLWILSRTPQMEPAVYNDLLKRIADRGYDTSALIKVKQKQNS
ncbi:lipocalin family protein [uncultured Draconibacterium sp.]|uniref:lipocalin family protein n=1 Tax=uncultured Draconibacterium sp. TaxID=1573823 RepID=UPI0025EC77BE|nr:lipocalin family protein [uncultured Draconibacterium sp.]